MASDSLLTEVTALPYAARFKSLREAGLEARTESESRQSSMHGSAAIGRNGFIACNPARAAAMRHDFAG